MADASPEPGISETRSEAVLISQSDRITTSKSEGVGTPTSTSVQALSQQSLRTITSVAHGTPQIASSHSIAPFTSRHNEEKDSKRAEQARNPLLKAFEEIKAQVYANHPTAEEEDNAYLADIPVNDSRGNAVKRVSSKPENDLDDLTAYIQGQLKGKEGGVDGSERSLLVPVPLRYRKPPRSRSHDEAEANVQKKTPDAPILFDYDFPDEKPERDKQLLKEFMGSGSHVPPLASHLSGLVQRASMTEQKKEHDLDGHFQRIFPEDPTWKLSIVDRLSEICLQTIQENFQDMPYMLASLPSELQQRFVPSLPVASEANLYLAADYFHNENYWEKSCKARWGRGTYTHMHGSWKLTYIEKGFQEMIENYVPLQSDPNILLNDLLNIGEYVLCLKIEQLLPPVRHTFGDFAAMVDAQLTNHVHFTEPYEETEIDPETNQRRSSIVKQVPMADEVRKYLGKEAEKPPEFPAVKVPTWTDKAKIKFQRLVNRELDLNKSINEDKFLMDITRELDDTPAHPRTLNPFLAADHMNLVPVMANMPHLMDLEIRYGVGECGMNFSWRLFQFTMNDAKRLAEALVICASMRRLCLKNSNIDDAKGAIVCYALLDHPNLAILELQCNRLGDETAAVIARMIKRSEVLNKVDLSENEIGEEGAKSLARSLVRGISLRILNLHMNRIGDRGAEAFFLVLKNCITFLQKIVLSGNNITSKIVDLLTDSMRRNRKLEEYDLSVNELEGVIASRKIQEALTQGHHIQQLNIQQNHFSPEFETCIQDTLARNQDSRLKEILTEMEHNFDFDIKNVRLPTEKDVQNSSSDGDSDESQGKGDSSASGNRSHSATSF